MYPPLYITLTVAALLMVITITWGLPGLMSFVALSVAVLLLART